MRKSRQYTSRAIEIPIGHPATQQGRARKSIRWIDITVTFCWGHSGQIKNTSGTKALRNEAARYLIFITNLWVCRGAARG